MQGLNHMDEILVLTGGLAVFIGILLQVIKVSLGGKMKKNLIPLSAIIVGLVVGTLAYPLTDLAIELRLIAGFLGGASACGLYDLVAKTGK